MGKALEIIGWLIIIATLFVLVVVAGNAANGRNALGLMLMMSWAVPAVIGGLMVAVFGRILQELQTSNSLSARQITLLEETLRSGRKPIEPIFGRDDR